MFEETRLLSTGERCLRDQCRDKVALIVAQRATYWKQRGKFRALRDRDTNTSFFHAKASGRACRNTIRMLEVDGQLLVTHDDKVATPTAYYTGILGGETATVWQFDLAHLYEGGEQADLEPLLAPFSEDEAWHAVTAMSVDSASGPDGVGPGFYTVAWQSIKAAVMCFLNAFHREEVDLQRINLTLIVKATPYRPICSCC